jgi:hypothetical protein
VKYIKGVVLVLSMAWAIPATAADEAPPAAVDQGAAVAAKGETAPKGSKGTMDRLELGTTAITGNRELPKVMYVVPWKHADLGDLGGKPLNSLVDEILAPVDRDVFRREISYFDALEPGQKAEVEKSVTASERAP